MAERNPMAKGVPTTTCTATNRQGQPCGRPPIPGGRVCRHHGGASPSVKEAAHRRLLAAVDPAITKLLDIVETAEKTSDQLRAAKEILDRAGIYAVRPEPVQVITMELIEAEIARLEAELGHSNPPGFAA